MKSIALIPAALFAILAAALPGYAADEEKKSEALPIAEVKRSELVDFEKEVLPILRRNCLACHNKTDAESDLVLETPQTIATGGSEGPAVKRNDPGASLMLMAAAHQADPFMPPKDNKVGAKNLMPEELGLIKLWIEQGAQGEVKGAAGPVAWQKIAPETSPIYAVAIAEDGDFVAAGRGNQIFMYHVPTKRFVSRLIDPTLSSMDIYKDTGAAHLDMVQSLAFSPDGQWLASGGYRNVKLWHRPQIAKLRDLPAAEDAVQSIATSADGKWTAIGQANGKIALLNAEGKVTMMLTGHTGPIAGLAFSADGDTLVSGSHDKSIRVWQISTGNLTRSIETPAAVNAVALVAEGKQVAAGGADNTIRTYALEAPAAPAEAAAAEGDAAAEDAAKGPQPIKEFAGHSGPITSLVAVGAGGVQLLSGSQDGTVRHWDVNAGNQIRQMNHGAPVVSVATRPDGTRFASASSNNTAKLWDASNGQQVAEMKGDFRATLASQAADREVQLAKRFVDLTKKDLDEANKRKKSEEDNKTKVEESKKKAEDDLKAKTEAAKKPEEDLNAAQAKLDEATKAVEGPKADVAKAEETVKAADEAVKKAQDELAKVAEGGKDGAQKKFNEAQDKKAKADEAVKAADEEVKKAQAELDAAADDAAKEAAQKKLAEAQEKKKQAEAAAKTADDELKVAQDVLAKAEAAQMTVDELTEKKKTADEALKTAQTAFNEAENTRKTAENDFNKIKGPAQKAIDERTAADRTLKAAMRSLERSAKLIEKATQEVADAEQAQTDAEEKSKQSDARKAEVDKGIAESEKPLTAVAFSADGSQLAVACENGQVRIYGAETGGNYDVLDTAGAKITALAFAADGSLVTAAEDKKLAAWDASAEWKLERTIGSVDSAESFVDRVTSLNFSPDSKLLATGGGEPSRSGELKFWNVEDGSLVREIPDAHSDTIFALEFSSDGKYIASCSADRFMKVFKVETGGFVKSFEGHTHHVLGVSWSKDNRTLATCGADKVIKVWDFLTGDQTKTITGFNKEITSLQFVALTENFVVGTGDKQVTTRNTGGGGGANYGGMGGFVYCVRASADGNTVVAGGEDSVVRVWSNNGQSIVNFDPPKPRESEAANQQAAN